jgi:hypothetical protein
MLRILPQSELVAYNYDVARVYAYLLLESVEFRISRERSHPRDSSVILVKPRSYAICSM